MRISHLFGPDPVRAALEAPGIGGIARLVLAALARAAFGERYVSAKIADLSVAAGCRERATQYAKQALLKLGYISAKRSSARYCGDTYALNLPAFAPSGRLNLSLSPAMQYAFTVNLDGYERWARRVLIAIAHHANTRGRDARPSQRTIGALVGLGRRVVRRVLQRFKADRRVLEQTRPRSRGRAATWRLKMPPPVPIEVDTRNDAAVQALARHLLAEQPKYFLPDHHAEAIDALKDRAGKARIDYGHGIAARMFDSARAILSKTRKS